MLVNHFAFNAPENFFFQPTQIECLQRSSYVYLLQCRVVPDNHMWTIFRTIKDTFLIILNGHSTARRIWNATLEVGKVNPSPVLQKLTHVMGPVSLRLILQNVAQRKVHPNVRGVLAQTLYLLFLRGGDVATHLAVSPSIQRRQHPTGQAPLQIQYLLLNNRQLR